MIESSPITDNTFEVPVGEGKVVLSKLHHFNWDTKFRYLLLMLDELYVEQGVDTMHQIRNGIGAEQEAGHNTIRLFLTTYQKEKSVCQTN